MHKQPTEFVVTCTSWQQAQHVADYILEQGFALQTELLPIRQGADGVSVIIESILTDVSLLRQELAAILTPSHSSQLQLEG